MVKIERKSPVSCELFQSLALFSAGSKRLILSTRFLPTVSVPDWVAAAGGAANRPHVVSVLMPTNAA